MLYLPAPAALLPAVQELRLLLAGCALRELPYGAYAFDSNTRAHLSLNPAVEVQQSRKAYYAPHEVPEPRNGAAASREAAAVWKAMLPVAREARRLLQVDEESHSWEDYSLELKEYAAGNEGMRAHTDLSSFTLSVFDGRLEVEGEEEPVGECLDRVLVLRGSEFPPAHRHSVPAGQTRFSCVMFCSPNWDYRDFGDRVPIEF